MSKLNKAKVAQVVPRELGFSANGNVQFVKSQVEQFFQLVVSTLYGRDSAYGAQANIVKARGMIKSILDGHGAKGAAYIARTAVFAREHMAIRTMPIVMAVELAKGLRDANVEFAGLKALIASVIQRADELTDLYAYALTVFGDKNKVPVAIKKGVALAFQKFDAYQFGKYNKTDGQVSFKRLLRIVHATPKDDDQSSVFAKLMAETLEAPHTWEVELSANGQKVKAERETDAEIWTRLLTREGSGSLPYMAMLRNVRNITQADVSSDTLKLLASKLSNEVSIKKSKMLPFGFITAYEMNEAAPMVVKMALGKAIEVSLANLPAMGERVWIILDCSGSMGSFGYSGKNPTNQTPIKIGAMFAAALFKGAAFNGSEVALSMFSDRAELVRLNPLDSTMSLYQGIMKKVYGGGTNLEAALAQKDQLGFEPDTVVVISDMEINRLSCSTTALNSLFKADTVKVALNIHSAETTPLDQRDGWQQLSGWSEGIFKFVDFSRKSKSISTRLFEGDIAEGMPILEEVAKLSRVKRVRKLAVN